jgi:Flp pilus assembly protein TadG
MATTGRTRLWACDRGATAVEFAMVLPPLVMLMMGTISACLLLFSATSLHHAVEQAARCYSVNATQCGSASAAQTYAKNSYRGLNKPQFTASTPACGHQVAATVSIALNAAIHSWKVPLTATACFP